MQLWTKRPVPAAPVGGMKLKTDERNPAGARVVSYDGEVAIARIRMMEATTVIATTTAGASTAGAIVLGAIETQAAVMKTMSTTLAIEDVAVIDAEAIQQTTAMATGFHLAPPGAVMMVLAAGVEAVQTALEDGRALRTGTPATVRTAIIEHRCR